MKNEESPLFFKKKVLVTGGCGFVGREVVKQLLEKHYEVIVIDDFSNSTLPEKHSSLKVFKLDLSKPVTKKLFQGVDFCIHLAARVGGVKYMNAFQSEILEKDILIDMNVISAASEARAKIVYASTVIVYDQLKECPFKEDKTILPPKSNYGFSKLIGERLCQVFSKDRGSVFTIARISNVYGINENNIDEKKLHVIPDLVRKILQEKSLKLINGGRQIRTFVHVSDLAKALILMMENEDANGEVFNVASGDRYQILELAKLIWTLLGKREKFCFESIGLRGEDFVDSSADSSKISKVLGWQPKQNLKTSLPEIVEWYKKRYER